MALPSCSYQVDWMSEAVEALLLQQLSEVGDVTRGQSQRVQFGQLGVRRNPGQAGFESGEGFAQHSHPRSFPGVGRVSLRLARVFRRVSLGCSAVLIQVLVRAPVVAGAFSHAVFERRGYPPVTCAVVISVAFR